MFIINAVYYSPQFNRFFQLRKIKDDCCICGAFTEYYEDSITTIQEQQLSFDFIKECILVKSLDKLTKFVKYDGIGWRVIERK